MRRKSTIVLIISGICLFNSYLTMNAQAPLLDEEGFEVFEMKEGDTTYVMKKYFLVLLKEGQNRGQSEAEKLTLQEGHLAHFDSLYSVGKLDIVGPIGEKNEISGVCIYNVKTKEEAIRLASLDPMVKSGRLNAEIIPWWTSKKACLR